MTDKADPLDPNRTIAADRARAPGGQVPGDAATIMAPRRPAPAAAKSPSEPLGETAPASLLQPGTVLNNTQRIEALIGRGGMGEVYRATNIHTGDQDAIKMIRPDLASDPQVRELFRREAAALRKVRHAAVVSYEGVFGDDGGRLFLVMEFVDGPSLASIIAQAPLAPDDVRRVGVQIAEGLAAAHACGVVHRDLSPDNVVLRGGRLDNAVLIDFGVAKRLDATSTVVGSGFAGKLDYCSPEQCGLYDGVDHRTDIYSLGLVLAAAAVGKHLPMGSSLAHAVKARETLPNLSAVPAALRADLGRLLEPDPARRPQSMREVAALLAYTAPPAAAELPSRPRRTGWIVAGVAAMLALFVAGVFVGPRLMALYGSGRTAATGVEASPAGSADAQRRAAQAAREKAEADRRAAEAQRQEEDERRQAAERAAAEAQRKAEEDRRAAEAQRQTEEARRLAAERAAAEAQRKAEEDRRAAEAQRQADEARRLAAERAAAEAQRKAEEERRAAEAQHQ
ncbi:MAG TPA: serine/threonine-protein kinase, partial [Vineibacter sp.]|nr:serine/threonine-protein kinase [Vineibacter sp.]